MNVSITRFSVAPVIALQWIAAIAMILLSHKCGRVFADFKATLPGMSTLALQATQAIVLVPLAMITTAIVVLAESLLESAAHRFVVQILVALLWFALTCFCITALTLAVSSVVDKLR
jgi:hypothetical protein